MFVDKPIQVLQYTPFTFVNILAVYAVSFGTRPVRPNSVGTINDYGPNALVGVGAGGVACNAPGIPTYLLRLPTALVFNGVPAPAGAPAFYTIDLFRLQQVVIHRYE